MINSIKAVIAEIKIQAIQDNLAQIKKISPNSQIMAVVKANAYGHGLNSIAYYASSADAFGVARIDEAIKLRAHGIVNQILLLEGFYSANDLPLLVANNIQTVVHCEEQLIALENAKLTSKVQVWLKIDIGMHRLGIEPEKYQDFIMRLKACDNVASELRYISHLGCADDLKSYTTSKQISKFIALTKQEPGEKSLSASAGLLAWPDSHLDWVRTGIIMYGISPFADRAAHHFGFTPVMTLKSRLIATRIIKKGEAVGYGATWSAPHDTKIGVVAIGYGDGYPRSAPNGTPVLINQRKVVIAGRVSMDMLTVDLGIDSQDQVGDEVILWGQELPVEEVAAYIGVISYELVTQLTSRVVKKYIP